MQGLFILWDDVGVDFLLVNFTGQHSDDKLIHCRVFVAFLEAFQHFDRADENIARNNVPPELQVHFF